MKEQVAILVPVYKPELSALEAWSLDHSLRVLAGRVVFFIAPSGLPRGHYERRYPGVPFLDFDAEHFASVAGYNRLLLDPRFYERFLAHEFVMILQPDAVILRDELDTWAALPFDYVGAPWPDGHELFINLGRFEGAYGKRVKVHVGNGGLSLRRTRRCIALLREFEAATEVFSRTGSNEDLFFAFMGSLSRDFVLPNEITASRFSMELTPTYYFHVNGGILPMGGHAWWKHEPAFWTRLLPPTPLRQADGDAAAAQLASACI